MFSKIISDYSIFKENKIKFLLDDSSNQKILTISIYFIRNSWYIDIFEPNNELLIGKIINTWVDIFELLKIYYKDFPKIKFLALPSNINGINKEFSDVTAGVTQELFLIESSG